jgi:hypothetical protein
MDRGLLFPAERRAGGYRHRFGFPGALTVSISLSKISLRIFRVQVSGT